jgi:hypothetical protein
VGDAPDTGTFTPQVCPLGQGFEAPTHTELRSNIVVETDAPDAGTRGCGEDECATYECNLVSIKDSVACIQAGFQSLSEYSLRVSPSPRPRVFEYLSPFSFSPRPPISASPRLRRCFTSNGRQIPIKLHAIHFLAWSMGGGIFPVAASLADAIAFSVAARSWGVKFTLCRRRLPW